MRRSVFTRPVIAATAMALAIGIAGVSPSDGDASVTRQAPGALATDAPAALRGIDIEPRIGDDLPLDLKLRDEQGREVALGDYFGDRPVIVTMVYFECPMLCTLTLNGLTKALRTMELEVGKDFDLVAVSIDPRETPELAARKKAAYVEAYGRPGSEDGFHFLTADDEAAVARLAGAIGFSYRYLPDEDEYAHAAAITMATPAGRITHYFYGIEYFGRDLRLGLIEAADGKIGTPMDKLLLYCFRYDPKSGSYAAYALAMVRVGGVATMLALGGFIVIARRRESRSERRS